MEPPEKFDFPFTPYDIQHSFMSSLYRILEGKQIGIFESPTGTGKSLSLTCGSLKWLLDHENSIKSCDENKVLELEADIKKSEDENAGKVFDWIDDQYGIIKKKESLVVLKKKIDLRKEYEKSIEEIRSRKIKEKKKNIDWKSKIKVEDKLLDIPEEETSFELLDLEEDDDDEIPTDEVKEKYKYTKIYYCSRTHSQLSQVVNEIKGTVFGKSTRIISLASRQNYCINPEVKKLGTNSLINERCLDLQKNKTKITATDEEGRSLKKSKTCNGCSFYSQKGNETLKEISLSEIMDIEELVEAGRKNKGCPYYSSRLAAADSQIIFLPYQMLLHQKTRELLGLDLKDSVIIIDEAHNLLDTISSIYSSEVSLDQLQNSLKQLTCYKKKYVTRFSSKNLLYINQIIFVVKRLLKIIEIDQKDKNASRMIFTQELMAEGEFFNINLFHLLEFADKTRLAQKVHGFSQKYPEDLIIEKPQVSGTSALLKRLRAQQLNKKKTKIIEKEVVPIKVNLTSTSSAIRPLLSFLESLTENCEDGRVLITPNSSLKYLLLNPSSHFEEILKDCRSLIVSGGTMQPISEFTDQLFHLHRDKVQLNCYGHVVPKEAVLPLSVSKGPTGIKFLFNFANRGNVDLLMELGRALQNVCNVVPNGIVCFFGSYDFLNSFYEALEKNGILSKIQNKKVVFREPRQSGQVEKILIDFGRAAKGKGLEG